MKRVFVRKIFPYDPTFGGEYSRYEGYKLITSKRRSPGIEKKAKVEITSKIDPPIFCSSLRRGKETAKLITKRAGVKQIKAIPELGEITFNLSRLLTVKEYEKFGSNLARRRFIEAFVQNRLSEKRKQIKTRIDKFLERLGKLPEGNYLVVSHSFFMKLLQVYLKNKNLFENPRILRRKFDYKKKTFGFGKGFDFRLG